jgi:nucleotide-binding universal stress UspA family protein
MMKILVATDFSTRSHRAVRQAGILARQRGASLTLLHVVDEDLPSSLVNLETTEGRRILEDTVASMPELAGVRCEIEVAKGVAHDAIVHSAASLSADLIVMGAHRKQVLIDIFVGTTLERVIRARTCSVLMVNQEVTHRYEKVVVAVDMSEASIHALRAVQWLELESRSRNIIVHAFNLIAKSQLYLADVPKDRITTYVEDERQRHLTELNEFLRPHLKNEDAWQPRVEEGDPVHIITKVTSEMAPDLVVVGTQGRSGVAKLLLGSVAEELLRTLETDVLAVPLPANPSPVMLDKI